MAAVSRPHQQRLGLRGPGFHSSPACVLVLFKCSLWPGVQCLHPGGSCPHRACVHNPDNHDGVIIDLEPDILECEVKWPLESITTNKVVEVMENQWRYFKS